MKKGLLLALGLTPFLLGWLFNWSLMTVFYHKIPFPLFLVGLLALGIWGLFAFLLSGGAGSSPRQVIGLLNLPALVVLVLIGFQELILGSFWMNAAGVWTQLFYLPVINLGFALTAWNHSGIFAACCASFVLLVGAAWLGCRLREKSRASSQKPMLLNS